MNKNNNNTPQMRFKEFKNTGEWQEKYLWQVTIWDKKFKGVDPKKQENTIKYYYYLADELKKLIREKGTVKILTTNKTNFFTNEEEVKYTLTEGEIICIPWGGNPIIQYYKGKFITSDNRIATSKDINILNNKFLYYTLINQLKLISSFYRGIGIKHPNMSQVIDMNILLPSIPEQQKIAEVLSTADELIDAERRKLEALKKYKKGLMQKLFPRDGEKVPEMRFPEFQTAGEWKTVRLGDILMSGSKNKVNDTSKYKKITIKLHNKGIEFSNIERKMADKRPFYIRKKDEIIIGKQNYFNGSIAIVSEEFDNTICSNAIMSFTVDKNFNNKFIYLSLSRESYLKKYSHFAAGTGQKELSEKDFLNFVLLVPSLEEQQKISEVLSTANELIDLEKRKLEALKKYKKGLMQKLFPNI